MMDADPYTLWKAVKEIDAGLYGHHKNSASSMKMKKPNGNFCKIDFKNAEVLKNFYSELYNNHENTKYDETVLNKIDSRSSGDPKCKPKTLTNQTM